LKETGASVDIKEIIEYYADIQPSLKDIYRGAVPPESRVKGIRTSPAGSGIVIPLAGKARYTLNGTSYELKPGLVLHAGAGMDLEKEVIGDQAWQCILLHYRIPEKEIFNFSCYAGHFCIETGVCARVSSCAKQLHGNEQNSGGMAALHRRSLFARLIEEMLLSAQRYAQDDEGNIADNAVAFLDKHYMENLSVSQLADLYGMDVRRFGYIFSKYTGLSALGYLISLRIGHAKDLLRTCSYTVEQVAESVGYTDRYYFSRLFKKYTGLSPTGFMLGAEKGRTGKNPL
jgi:AraC-like DNA-binding protein